MNPQLKSQFKKPFNITIVVFILLIIGAYIFTQNNAHFYKTPVGQITNITNKTAEQTIDQNKNKDTLHKEKIHLKIMNGKHKGDKIEISHKYTNSLTDSEKYHKKDQVLLSYKGKEDTAIIKGLKRDGSVTLMTGLFLLTLLLVGRKSGLYSIISLVINVTVLLFMIDYFMKHNNHHFFILMTITVIFSTVVSLIIVS